MDKPFGQLNANDLLSFGLELYGKRPERTDECDSVIEHNSTDLAEYSVPWSYPITLTDTRHTTHTYRSYFFDSL
jgi:hypothetical protein